MSLTDSKNAARSSCSVIPVSGSRIVRSCSVTAFRWKRAPRRRRGGHSYRRQPLVVTTTERDSNVPGGLIAWLRDQPLPEPDRPFILAVEDTLGGAGPGRQADALRGWDGLMTLPLNPVQLAERLPAIDQWMSNRRREKAGPGRARLRGSLGPFASQEPIRQTAGRLLSPPPVTSRISLPGPSPQPSFAAGQSGGDEPVMSPVEQFQALIDNSPLAMALCDRQMRYIVVNERWKRDFQFNGMDVSGRAHQDFFRDLGSSWPQLSGRALDGIPQRRADDYWVRTDGTEHRVSWDLQPWVQASGRVGGVTMTCEVMGPRPAASKANQDWEQAGRVLLEGSFAPVVTLDLRGTILAVNGSAANLAGDRTGQHLGELCFWEAFVEEGRRETVKIEFLAASQESREQGRFAFPRVSSSV